MAYPFLVGLELMFLLVCSALCAGSESALSSVNQDDERKLKRHSTRCTQRLCWLLARREQLITTVIVQNTALNMVLSSVVTLGSMELWGAQSVWKALVAVTCVIILCGEMFPKALGARYSLGFLMWIAPFLQLSYWLLYPCACVSSALMHVLEGIFLPRHTTCLSREEIKTLIAVGAREGVISSTENQLFQRALQFKRIPLAHVMVPHTHFVSVFQDTPLSHVWDAFRTYSFSQLLVHDAAGIVWGFVHYWDIFGESKVLPSQSSDQMVSACVANTRAAVHRVGDLAQELCCVPNVADLFSVLDMLSVSKQQMALVVDERGDGEGLVTMTDIMEVIFGSLAGVSEGVEGYTVHGSMVQRMSKPRVDFQMKSVGTHEILCSGTVPLEYFNEVLGTRLQSRVYHTVGGLLLERFGRLPTVGDELVIEGLRFKIRRVLDRYVVSALVDTRACRSSVG